MTHSSKCHRSSGFTLTETLITLVIVGILGAIAIPGYLDYVARSERGEARILLYRLVGDQEHFFLRHGRYATTMSELGLPPPAQTASGRYQLSIQRSNSTGFAIRATRLSADREAKKCAWFEINQQHARRSAPASIDECWMR
ncbi:MAG: type IV pilin protein [Pseudomonadota bacterium]